MTLSPQIYEDAEIISLDGEFVGRVKEVRGAYFKVDAPHQRDYWLPAEAVEFSDLDTVRLLHEKAHLEGFALDGPAGHTPDQRGPDPAEMDFETEQGEVMQKPGGHSRGTV